MKRNKLVGNSDRFAKRAVEGIFFDGQIFDAYHFVADLIRKATHSIVLIDNYVDDSVLAISTTSCMGHGPIYM